MPAAPALAEETSVRRNPPRLAGSMPFRVSAGTGSIGPFSPRLAAFVLQAFSAHAPEKNELESLTPREREVLHHLARGYAYKRIAQRLGISDRTVETHVGNVLRKLQLTSRHEVSHWAAKRGLVD